MYGDLLIAVLEIDAVAAVTHRHIRRGIWDSVTDDEALALMQRAIDAHRSSAHNSAQLQLDVGFFL